MACACPSMLLSCPHSCQAFYHHYHNHQRPERTARGADDLPAAASTRWLSSRAASCSRVTADRNSASDIRAGSGSPRIDVDGSPAAAAAGSRRNLRKAGLSPARPPARRRPVFGCAAPRRRPDSRTASCRNGTKRRRAAENRSSGCRGPRRAPGRAHRPRAQSTSAVSPVVNRASVCTASGSARDAR